MDGVNFEGTGEFKFALIRGSDGAVLWCQDGSVGPVPAASVQVAVERGVYSIQLGDLGVPGMSALSPSLFLGSEDVRLRVWFSDGVHGWQQLSPDQRFAASPYSLVAATVPDGSLTLSKFAANAGTPSSYSTAAAAADGVLTAGGRVVPLSELAAAGSSQGALTVSSDSLGRTSLPPPVPRTNLRLRRALRDLETGVRSSLRILSVGDSLGGNSWNTINAQLAGLLSGHLKSSIWYGVVPTDTANAPVGGAGATTAEFHGSSSAERVYKTDFDVSWIGIATRHTTGTRSVWAVGNTPVWADRILIPVVKETGAGSLRVEIAPESFGTIPAANSSLWRAPTQAEVVSGPAPDAVGMTISADATERGLQVVELSLPLGRWALRLTQVEGGRVRTLDPMFEVRDASAVNVYTIASGSNSFGSSSPASTPLMAEVLRVYNPDLIVIESDDSKANYDHFLPQLEASLTQSGLVSQPLVLLVGNPALGSGFGTTQSDLALRIDAAWQFALPRGWDVLDGLSLAQGLAGISTVGWQGDGVHLTPDIWRQLARIWAQERGYFPIVERRPGGELASRADVASMSSNRNVTADGLLLALVHPGRLDTRHLTWESALQGNSTFAWQPEGYFRMSTYYGNSSTAAAFPRASGSNYSTLPLGDDTGLISLGRASALGLRLRLTHGMSATARGFILIADRTSNSTYLGPLTAEGVGFEITAGGLIRGVAWNGTQMVYSERSTTLSTGPNSDFQDLRLLMSPNAVANSRGRVEFFVGSGGATGTSVSLGTAEYQHFSRGRLRIEITAGGVSGENTFDFTAPIFAQR